jgi:hypothetical protein
MKQKLFTILVLFCLSAAAFQGVAKLGFIAYDDPDYVSNNPIVQRGLTSEGIAWAFGSIHGERTYWHPVTWVTHMVDCQLFGLRGGAHHIVSLLFHTANAILLFLLLFNTTGAFWTSAVAAGLFAVHPFQVESVVWITERKNLVSTFFGLITLLSYVRYTRSITARWYVLALGLFALALMSKPAVVTLPCVMLLLDFWPLRRLQRQDQGGRFSVPPARSALRLVVEKIPFFVLSGASAALTLLAHRDLGMLGPATKPPAGLLLSNIALSYFQYLRKFFWPSDLAVFYPFPLALPSWEVIGALAILLVISVFVLIQRKRRP